jgi:hypothetical protein
MPGYGTNFEAPVFIGTRPTSGINSPAINDYGVAQVLQRGTIVANSSLVVSGTIFVPIGSTIIDITEDTVVAWNAGSVVATIGTAAADTSFAPSTTITATGRYRPTFTATNLLNMGSVSGTGSIVWSVTPSVSCSAGKSVFTIEYAPNQNTYVGAT